MVHLLLWCSCGKVSEVEAIWPTEPWHTSRTGDHMEQIPRAQGTCGIKVCFGLSTGLPVHELGPLGCWRSEDPGI